MKRLDYETLAMREIVVEVEDGFLVTSVSENTKVETTGHELNVVEGSLFDVVESDEERKGMNGWK